MINIVLVKYFVMNGAYKNKVLGSMIGGAVGDALGYPVEFMNYYQILQKYGRNGITRYELNSDGIAEISDDTQMSLFTANGMLFCFTRFATYGGLGASPSDYIRDSYLEWLQTQTGEIDYTEVHYNWIRDVEQLHIKRAPGLTCISALQNIADHKAVVNDSKGCGGIMRVAPIALFAAKPISAHDYPLCLMDFAKEAGKAAALTHKHPLGYIPAAFLSALVQKLMPYSYLCPNQLRECIDVCFSVVTKLYPEHQAHIDYMQKLVNKAIQLSAQNKSDIEAISQLGEGWVAEETLAIAIYCVFKYPDNFEKAIIASVNHSGDSDSTGAVTGNIMGALLGYDAIPDYYKENLELRWLIEELADDLATDIPVEAYGDNYDTPEKRNWMKKYVEVIERGRVPIKNSYAVNSDLSIFAGEYPGDKDDNICRMKVQDVFLWSKIRYFYDLTCEGELTPYAHYLGHNKVHIRFPIPDCGTPANTRDVARLCQEIIYRGENGTWPYDGIYIHCWGGVGRTGTIVACLYAYLMREQKLSADEIYLKAMQQLQESFRRCPKSKRRVSPENDSQRDFIRRFIENECVL